jgi:hypothetical protein
MAQVATAGCYFLAGQGVEGRGIVANWLGFDALSSTPKARPAKGQPTNRASPLRR